MLAPPAPPAPVASSSPPSPFGPTPCACCCQASLPRLSCALVFVTMRNYTYTYAVECCQGWRGKSAKVMCRFSPRCPELYQFRTVRIYQSGQKTGHEDEERHIEVVHSSQHICHSICMVSYNNVCTSMHTGHAYLPILPLIQSHSNRAFKVLLHLHTCHQNCL